MGTEIVEACKRGDVEAVKRFVAEDESNANTRDEEGKSFLFRAAESGSFELVKLLIASKADVNGGDHVLHALAASQNISMKTIMIADVLVRAKADIACKKDDETPIEALMKRPDRDAQALIAELKKVFENPVVESPRSPMIKRQQRKDDAPSPKCESPKSARPIERSESLKKLLEFKPGVVKRPSTPPKHELESPMAHTPPRFSPKLNPVPREESFNQVIELESENEKLRAENAALRDEVKRYRTTMSKFDARQQLKELYARLIQLESIESALEAINP